MTNKHPHADILQYLIDGGDISNIESKYDLSSKWVNFNKTDIVHLLTGNDHFSFRIKPKTVMFNGVELPMYETNPLKYDDFYYMPTATADFYVTITRWFDDDLDTKRLERGLVFLKEEDAAAWGKAMCPKTS